MTSTCDPTSHELADHDDGELRSITNPSLPHDFVEDMSDQLNGLDDVQRSLDLLEILIDPVMISGAVLHQMDHKQLGAMLRNLNSLFHSRLKSARNVLGTPYGREPRE
ncbi:MAG: hypothetical protein V4757_03245 [Pseudomonadota bacterium]